MKTLKEEWLELFAVVVNIVMAVVLLWEHLTLGWYDPSETMFTYLVVGILLLSSGLFVVKSAASSLSKRFFRAWRAFQILLFLCNLSLASWMIPLSIGDVGDAWLTFPLGLMALLNMYIVLRHFSVVKKIFWGIVLLSTLLLFCATLLRVGIIPNQCECHNSDVMVCKTDFLAVDETFMNLMLWLKSKGTHHFNYFPNCGGPNMLLIPPTL